MANREEIIQRNIAFMYGRGEKTAIADPDKFSFTKSHKFDENADAIRDFAGEYDFLSPGYLTPVLLALDMQLYPSFEHGLQASKTNDPAKRRELSEISNIRELKKMGLKYADNPSQWREIGVQIAEQLIRDKFIRNSEIRQKLKATKRRNLIFTNEYDAYWGVKMDGKGQNQLGKCIEMVRLQIERGDDINSWLKGMFRIFDADDICFSTVIKRGTETVEDFNIEEKPVLYIGKTPNNDIQCESPTVSRQHAVLVADKTMGLLIVDLNSANKTFVNDIELTPYSWKIICKDDHVRFGASSRLYQFTLESGVAERRRQQLYDKVANPEADKNGKTATGKELTVFVGNLPYSIMEVDVRVFFETCGAIVSLSLPRDKASGDGHRGIAFVEFADVKGLTQALMKNGDELQGRALKIVRQTTNRNVSKVNEQSGSFQNKSKDYSLGDKKSYYTREVGAPPAALLSTRGESSTRESSFRTDDRIREKRRRRSRSADSTDSNHSGHKKSFHRKYSSSRDDRTRESCDRGHHHRNRSPNNDSRHNLRNDCCSRG